MSLVADKISNRLKSIEPRILGLCGRSDGLKGHRVPIAKFPTHSNVVVIVIKGIGDEENGRSIVAGIEGGGPRSRKDSHVVVESIVLFVTVFDVVHVP